MEFTGLQVKENPGSVGVVGELLTGREGAANYQPGGENWSVAFAPDESIFAWSCGFRKIVILPWNTYKNCFSGNDGAYNPPSCDLFCERVSIDAGFPVTALAFGTGIPESDLVKRQYWTRFDHSKDLILATGHTNGRIRIWDPFTGKLLLELTDHMKPVTCLAFAPDGSLRLVSGSKDTTVKVWDVYDDGNMFKTFKQHPGCVRGVCWSPDARLLCSTGDKQKVLLWDMEQYELHKRLSGHYNTVLAAAFSPDGAMLATASCDTRVIVWHTSTGEQLRVLSHLSPAPGIIYMSGENNSAVRGVSFSPNGCHLVSICADGLVRFWNLDQDQDEPESEAHGLSGDTVLSCTFSPAGGTVAVGHGSGSVLFFQPPTLVPSLLHLSRMCVRRSLGDVTHHPEVILPHSLKPYLQYKQW